MITAFDILTAIYLTILYICQGTKKVSTNSIIVSISNMIIMRVWLYFIITSITFTNSNIYQALAELIICYLLEDFYAYGIHRYMHHNKTIYKYVHAQHHQHQAESFLTAFDVHPAELVAFYFVGLSLGPFLISCFWTISSLGFMMWLYSATFYLIWSHTGIDISYFQSTKFHYLHHKYYNCNYGTTMSDKLFGTARYE